MSNIEKYRSEIDDIDSEIIELLSRRFDCSIEIGKIKKREGLSVLQTDRWGQVASSRTEYAKKFGLSEEFILDFLHLVHAESIRIQNSMEESE